MEISIKRASQTSVVKDKIFNKSVITVQSFGKSKATSPNHYLDKNKLQMDQRFKVNNEAIKELDENVTEFIYNLGRRWSF